jgi:hypothetical protein
MLGTTVRGFGHWVLDLSFFDIPFPDFRRAWHRPAAFWDYTTGYADIIWLAVGRFDHGLGEILACCQLVILKSS